MKKCAVAAVLAAWFGLSIGTASAYTALFAFGDSLSDAGNAYLITGGTTPPSPPYDDGHFSNGPTWVEDLSLGLGLGVLKPSLAGGTDFAIGGATTGAILNGEVNSFEAYVTAAHVTQATLNGALFTLDIGAIDILNALTDPATAAGVVTAAANSAATEVKELNSDGARNFLFYEVPELSLTPEVQALGSAAGTLADTLAQTFNSTLLSDLGSVETGADALNVVALDTYDFLAEAVASPAKYGFANVTEPCLLVVACATASPTVQDTFLFWDTLHPTEGGHMQTAALAYGLVAPEPSTWAMMLLGFIGLGYAGYRGRNRMTAVA
jgi:phospholipase/lecithinase/hemolysin